MTLIMVPLVTALGIGLAHSIHGRNPMVDGFGLIAFQIDVEDAVGLVTQMPDILGGLPRAL